VTGPAGLLERVAAAARRHPRAAVAGALLVVPVLLLREALAGGVVYQRDVHLYWLPQAENFVRALVAGSWPSWDPTMGFGQPFLANSSTQVLYPFTWLNLLLRPGQYYTAFVLAHLVLSAAGAYRAARAMGCSRAASLVGATAWTASGPLVSLAILWHHFAGAAWLPWVAAAALGVARRGARGAPALALALGGQQLAGSFDMSTMGVIVTAVAVWCGAGWRRPWAPEVRPAILATAGALALAAGISAGQWMATAEVAAHSGRRALPRETRTYWSVHPLSAADFVLPGLSAALPVADDLRRELFESREPFLSSLYLGLAASGFVLAALADRGRRRAAVPLAAVGTLALLVALGRHAPVYDVVVAVVPPLRAFRYPVKATVLLALAWSLLAALGFDAWRRDPRTDPGAARAIGRLAVGVAAAGVAAAALLAAYGAGVAARNAAVAAGIALCAAATWAVRGKGARTGPAAMAAALAIADLVFYHRSAIAVAPPALYAHRPEVLRHLTGPGVRLYAYDYSARPTADAPVRAEPRVLRAPAGWGPGPAAALAQQMALVPVTHGRWGLRGSFEVDYTGLFPVHVNQAAYLLRALEGTPAHRRMLQLAGVTHVVALHAGTFEDLVPIATEEGLYDVPIRVFGVPDPQPRVYVAAATRAGEGMEGLNALVDEGFDFRREVLVPASAEPAAASSTGTARIVRENPTALSIEVDAPGGGYLVVLDSYERGWRATVDGQAAAIVPANVLFRGVRVGPGRHAVILEHRPPGQRAGIAVSAIALLITGALTWRAGRQAAHGTAA
jgi:membrane protein YfhO